MFHRKTFRSTALPSFQLMNGRCRDGRSFLLVRYKPNLLKFHSHGRPNLSSNFLLKITQNGIISSGEEVFTSFLAVRHSYFIEIDISTKPAY